MIITPDTFASVVEEWGTYLDELRADVREFAVGVRERQVYTTEHATEMVDKIVERTQKVEVAFAALREFTRDDADVVQVLDAIDTRIIAHREV